MRDTVGVGLRLRVADGLLVTVRVAVGDPGVNVPLAVDVTDRVCGGVLDTVSVGLLVAVCVGLGVAVNDSGLNLYMMTLGLRP